MSEKKPGIACVGPAVLAQELVALPKTFPGRPGCSVAVVVLGRVVQHGEPGGDARVILVDLLLDPLAVLAHADADRLAAGVEGGA